MTRSSTDVPRQDRPLEPRATLLVLLAGIVLAFRTAAWWSLSSFVVAPPSLAIPLNGLGILFLACGAWRPSQLTRVFLTYGLGGGIHWGGSIGAGNTEVEIAILVFYLAVTSVGDAAFLDLSLCYPRSQGLRGGRRLAIYVPANLTFLSIPIAPFVARTTLESLLGLAIGVAFLLSIVAGIVFVVKWIRATPGERLEDSLTLIAGAVLVSGVLALLADGGLLPGAPEACWGTGSSRCPWPGP